MLYPESEFAIITDYAFTHETERKGTTCKKIYCYMRDSACRWFIVKKAKIF